MRQSAGQPISQQCSRPSINPSTHYSNKKLSADFDAIEDQGQFEVQQRHPYSEQTKKRVQRVKSSLASEYSENPMFEKKMLRITTDLNETPLTNCQS